MKELRHPDHKFPAEVTALDFAQNLNSRYKFGLDTKKAVAMLRKLADGMESGGYLLQGCESTQNAVLEDFSTNSLKITWAQKRQADELTGCESLSTSELETTER